MILAELLGLPHATIIMQVEKQDGGIRVKRELEDGWFQHVEMPLPALLTIQSGINKLRYATLMGIKKAKTQGDQAADRGASSACAGKPRIVASSASTCRRRTKQTQLFEGAPKEAAAQAGREAEVRGAGHMSGVWWSWSSAAARGTACRSRRWPPPSSSATRAEHCRSAPRCSGSGIDALAGGAGAEASSTRSTRSSTIC